MIETFNGQFFSLNTDSLEGLTIDNIAHALSMVNRFNGHTKFPYSVAEHSVHVASQLPPDLQLIGLLHDGSEAFIQDIPAPFKPYLPDYAVIEKQVQDRVYRAFGMDPEWVDSVYAEVKHVDSMMCQVEATHLLHSTGAGWASNPANLGIYGLSPVAAEGLFYLAFDKITKGNYFTGPLTPAYLQQLIGEHNAINSSGKA
jgi:hypothetical protein